MSRIPFIEARFFDPNETRQVLERRFTRHLKHLRLGNQIEQNEHAPFEDSGAPGLHEDDRRRIYRRVSSVLERRRVASGADHLNREDRERLEILRDGVELIAIASEHRADELASELHAGMPWMAPATELVWQAMRRSVREGWPGLRLPPLLLDGPPGIGKSHWARRLGEILGTPAPVTEATGENASFGVVGSQRGWGGACPGRLLETILQSRIGNPVIVVDEIEKAGRARSRNGRAFGLAEALLPLLESLSARHWSCPYYRVKFDMSWVGWVLTSNNSRLLPEPLLSRCPPIRLQALSRGDLVGFVRREGEKRGLSEDMVEAIAEAMKSASADCAQLNLRTASRLLQRAEALENAPVQH
ncbi:AAA family ATPase [uncultured Celeribacter sp.]|uniref:AAA family ATPase n=1 Tax=uncultured Celeribacter sp. TaxID=1303376 RepID=UPI002AA73D35|nr:AAA family ATPase [uncultured Celeribacter sp.]